MLKILVVAQTPPPFHGQSIMTQYLLQGRYKDIELHHVRMAFSGDIEQVGRFGLGKVLHLFGLIAKIVHLRFCLRADVLYYPPAGPNLVPFLRDCILLVATRWLFRHTVFHFHAAGLSQLLTRLPLPLKIFARMAYGNPDVGISISKDGLRDAELLGARHAALVPNGIPDIWPDGLRRERREIPAILFLGMVCEEKGAGVLIEACKILHSLGLKFVCKIAGRGSSDSELAKLKARAAGLDGLIEFVGPVAGEAKWDLFANSDVFCFPTYYASESFGLVVVEAMMSGLPVVTSDWRALPEIVEEGKTGFLAPARDPHATATALARLLGDSGLRVDMGEAGRARYLKHYRVEIFRRGMEEALRGVNHAADHPQ